MKIENSSNEYRVDGVNGVYRYENAYNFSALYFYPEGENRRELVKKVGIPGVLESGKSNPDPDFRAAIEKHAAGLISA